MSLQGVHSTPQKEQMEIFLALGLLEAEATISPADLNKWKCQKASRQYILVSQCIGSEAPSRSQPEAKPAIQHQGLNYTTLSLNQLFVLASIH